MASPRFAVLEVVSVAELPAFVEHGLAGLREVVTQVRSYPDGSFRYGVRSEDPDDRDEVGGLYDEAHLISEGRTVPAEIFDAPGPFAIREVVDVSLKHGERRIAGHRVVVDGWTTDDIEGSLLYYVWDDQSNRIWLVPSAELSSTGERLPPKGPREVTSARVEDGGVMIGEMGYWVLDDVEDHL